MGALPKPAGLPCEFLMLDPRGLQGIGTEAAFLVLLIVFEIALKPFHMRIALKGQDMGADPVKEKAVEIRNSHGKPAGFGSAPMLR